MVRGIFYGVAWHSGICMGTRLGSAIGVTQKQYVPRAAVVMIYWHVILEFVSEVVDAPTFAVHRLR